MSRVAVLLCAALGLARAMDMPSCEGDTEAHCIGEGADLSPEGIDACLQALGADKRSALCNTYLQLMQACEADIGRGGVCESANMDGEAVPCLLQRVKPEQLSAACQAALPAQEAASGLSKFWSEGKRELTKAEITQLDEEDDDTYTRWLKRKKGKKSDKDKDREYAVREQKKAQATKAVIVAATEAAAAAISNGDSKEAVLKAATSAATAAAEAELKGDMTGTLKAFTSKEITSFAKTAEKEARNKKTEL